jgi:hypothetical protein
MSMNKDRDERRVARAIMAALELIAEQEPELAQLLRETIKTGEYLTYSPEPRPTPRRKSWRTKRTPHRQGKNPLQRGRK